MPLESATITALEVDNSADTSAIVTALEVDESIQENVMSHLEVIYCYVLTSLFKRMLCLI